MGQHRPLCRVPRFDGGMGWGAAHVSGKRWVGNGLHGVHSFPPVSFPHPLMKESSSAPSSLQPKPHVWFSNPSLLAPPTPLFSYQGTSSLQGLGLQIHMPHTSSSFPGVSSFLPHSCFIPPSLLRRLGAPPCELHSSPLVIFFLPVAPATAPSLASSVAPVCLPHQGQMRFFFFFNFYFILE